MLGYLDEHPEQAWLLGIHVQTSPVTGSVLLQYQFNCNLCCLKGTGQLKKVAAADGQFVTEKPVPWTAMHCAKALNLLQPATV